MHDLRLAWMFFRIGAMNELQYRVNFFLQLFQSILAISTGLISLWLIFSHTSSLHGWNPAQLLIVMGVFTVMGGVIQATIQPNMTQLITDIQQGTFDYTLTKPADAQLLASIRQVEIWESVDVLTGFVVVVIGVLRLQSKVGLEEALAFLLMLVIGGILIYCFWMILTTLAFWVTNMWHVVELFQGVYNAGRYPIGIYPGWLRYGLTFLVPVAFAVTVPSEALTGRLGRSTALLAFGLTAVLLAVTRTFWRFGLRRYSGASA
jgi:ABC-2 type transport system permease protein